jgi:SAM-dependent methyltransferase
MDAEYGRRYADLYRRHWWWRARKIAVLQEVRHERQGRGLTRILDVGCGDGLFFDELGAFGQVQGVEPDEQLLTPGSPHAARIRNVPFDDDYNPPQRFGLMLFLDVLEHIEDPVAALRHALNLLEPDGRIIVTVPAFTWLWTGHDELNHHYARYSESDFRRIAGAAGADVTRARYLFPWLVPAKLLVRAREWLHKAPPAPPAIPPGIINEALFIVSRLQNAVSRRLHPPFGSSLLVVLRRPRY